MKNSPIIIGSVIVILVLVSVLYFVGRGEVQAPATAQALSGTIETARGSVGDLAAAEKSYDFGTISMRDGKVEKLFTITNPSSEDVLVRSVVTSCMCTVAYLENGPNIKGPFGMPGHGGPSAPANDTIKAGESRTIRVVFDPNAHGPAGVGPIDRQIILSDGAKNFEFRISGSVTP